MIQKLHRRFLIISMAMLGVVLLVSLSLLLASSIQSNVQRAEDALTVALTMDNAGDRPRLEQDRRDAQSDSGKSTPFLATFTVTVDQRGNVVSFSGLNVEVEGELAEQALQAAWDKGTRQGILANLQLRFRCQDQPDGTIRYAFVDTSPNRSANVQMIVTYALVFLAAMGVLFAVCWFLSRMTLKPVQMAWEQQRQFVADASHELKTPLTVILANSDILAAHPDDTIRQQKKWVDYIQSEAQRMKGLVEQMLFLARSDQAQFEVPVQVLNLSDCLWEALLHFESVAFEAGISLDCQIAEGCYLQGNSAQLKQLAMILLDNACKYTPRGGAIQVSLYPQEEGLVLSVTNLGGEPIPPESLPHLFERFYRSDASRSRDQGGYGLGLSIAETIVRTHSGKISVTSSKENGTTFTIRFLERKLGKELP